MDNKTAEPRQVYRTPDMNEYTYLVRHKAEYVLFGEGEDRDRPCRVLARDSSLNVLYWWAIRNGSTPQDSYME